MRTVLCALTAACVRANGCYWTRIAIENGTRTVHKGFRDPKGRRGCRWNHWSGLRPPEAYALEVAILERLYEPRERFTDPRQGTSKMCRGSYFPRLLRRDDANLTFVQSYAGAPLLEGSRACMLSESHISDFAECAQAALHAARVEHFDLGPKNTVLRGGGELSVIDFDVATLDGLPRAGDLLKDGRRFVPRKKLLYGAALALAVAEHRRSAQCTKARTAARTRPLGRARTVSYTGDAAKQTDWPPPAGVAAAAAGRQKLGSLT